MDRYDRLGIGGNSPLDQLWIHRISLLIDVHKDRFGATKSDGFRRRHEGARHRNHFVSLAYAEGQQTQPERLGPAAQSNGKLAATEGSEVLLETGHEWAAGEGVCVDDLLNGGIDLAF